MRTIKVVACYALVIMLTLLVPVSAQVSDFTIDVPGASSTLPRGINPRGDVVGFYGADAAFHGFLLQAGALSDIDVPGAAFTRPRSINPQGDVVGFYGTGSVSHGFLLVEGSFTTIDVPGASSTQAFGINPRGDIVGLYSAGGANHGFLLDLGTLPPLMFLAPHPRWPWVSILAATSLANTLPRALLTASSFTRAPLPPSTLLALHPPRRRGSTLGGTSSASTLLGGSRMDFCSTRTAALPALKFLAPHPPRP